MCKVLVVTSGTSAVVDKFECTSVAQLLEFWLGMKKAMNWMVKKKSKETKQYLSPHWQHFPAY